MKFRCFINSDRVRRVTIMSQNTRAALMLLSKLEHVKQDIIHVLTYSASRKPFKHVLRFTIVYVGHKTPTHEHRLLFPTPSTRHYNMQARGMLLRTRARCDALYHDRKVISRASHRMRRGARRSRKAVSFAKVLPALARFIGSSARDGPQAT